MLRIGILVLALSVGSVPPSEESGQTVQSLEGTTWAGDGAVAFTIYRFERGGVLGYSYNNSSYRNGTWKQEGDSLYFECNKKYYEFRGTIRDNEITGQSWNIKGGKWNLRFERQWSPEP